MPITDDHLRAALLRSTDLSGEWSERFFVHDTQCAGRVEPTGLTGSYSLSDSDASFSIKSFSLSGADAPTSIEAATAQWLRDCRGHPESQKYTLYETGRVASAQLDFPPDSTFVALYRDIFLVATFSRSTVEAPPKTILPKVIEQLEAALVLLPEDLPEAEDPWVPPEPTYNPLSAGCFDGPAWQGEYVDISPAWNGQDALPAHPSPFDLNGDGSPDRVVIHENGDLQVDLGTAGWTSLITAFASYELAGIADLDNNGDDELLLQRNGNNYGGIEVADFIDCELQLALSTRLDDTAFFGNWCSSNSCIGILRRTDCVVDDTGAYIRHYLSSVPDDQLEDFRFGRVETAPWDHTVTDHRLVNGAMTTELVSTTGGLTYDEALAAIGEPESRSCY